MGIAVPIIMVILFAYSYYVYVVEVCLLKATNVTKRILYLVFYHLIALHMAVYYFICLCVQTEDVPEDYYFGNTEYEQVRRENLSNEQLNRILQGICVKRRIHTFTRKNGVIRYCLKCKLIKPDRTHHCSTCQRCVLKMDHHCPWINNCVGFRNYKFFLLLLTNVTIYCFYYTGTTIEYLIKFFHHMKTTPLREVQYIVICVIMCACGIACFCLLVYHLNMMLNNETTLEAMSPDEFVEDVTFNLGTCDNFLEVFGYNWFLWCMPVMTSLGDGVTFPVKYLNISRSGSSSYSYRRSN